MMNITHSILHRKHSVAHISKGYQFNCVLYIIVLLKIAFKNVSFVRNNVTELFLWPCKQNINCIFTSKPKKTIWWNCSTYYFSFNIKTPSQISNLLPYKVILLLKKQHNLTSKKEFVHKPFTIERTIKSQHYSNI